MKDTLKRKFLEKTESVKENYFFKVRMENGVIGENAIYEAVEKTVNAMAPSTEVPGTDFLREAYRSSSFNTFSRLYDEFVDTVCQCYIMKNQLKSYHCVIDQLLIIADLPMNSADMRKIGSFDINEIFNFVFDI